MDDANVPVSQQLVPLKWLTSSLSKSLLSLPYLGFLDKKDPTYQATRKLLLSPKNPYFAAGKTFSGTGYAICWSLRWHLITNTLQRSPRWSMASLVRSTLISKFAAVDGSWRPMSQISAIFGTDDDAEIMRALYTIANVSCIQNTFAWQLLKSLD